MNLHSKRQCVIEFILKFSRPKVLPVVLGGTSEGEFCTFIVHFINGEKDDEEGEKRI